MAIVRASASAMTAVANDKGYPGDVRNMRAGTLEAMFGSMFSRYTYSRSENAYYMECTHPEYWNYPGFREVSLAWDDIPN